MNWQELFELELKDLDDMQRIEKINAIRKELHKFSPFQSEPVDCILWVPTNKVRANDYNPNIVAPPEMKLLQRSIDRDGFTQPIVTWKNSKGYEVVDGFHRNRVAKEYKPVSERIKGYLPVTIINENRSKRGSRIASTIRHNRARGKHTVEGMSDIVLELKGRNWKNARIAKELGMDEDEILRLCQITGLADLFSDQEFSKSWNVEDYEEDFEPITDEFEVYELESERFRTVNTDDESRIFHTHDKWECLQAGFYNTTMDGMTKEQCERAYADFLRDTDRFARTLEKVIIEWKHSCEHYLTNRAMNRIAWLGQAAMCYATGIPSTFRAGFNLLTKTEQDAANETALIYLNKWLEANNAEKVTMEEALEPDRQMELY